MQRLPCAPGHLFTTGFISTGDMGEALKAIDVDHSGFAELLPDAKPKGLEFGFTDRNNVNEKEIKMGCEGDSLVMRRNPPSLALHKASCPTRESPSSTPPNPCTHSTCSSLRSGLPPQLPKSVSTPAQAGPGIHRHEAQRDKTVVSHRVPTIVHGSRFILIGLNEPLAVVH